MIIIIFIAIFSQITKKSGEETFDANFILIFLVFVVLSFFVGKNSKSELFTEKKIYLLEQNNKLETFKKITNNRIEQIDSPDVYLSEYIMQANNIDKQIDKIKEQLFYYCKAKNFAEINDQELKDENIGGTIMILEANAENLKTSLNSLSDNIIQNDNIFHAKEIPSILLETNTIVNSNTQDEIPWEYYYFEHKQLIDILIKLNQIQIDIYTISLIIY